MKPERDGTAAQWNHDAPPGAKKEPTMNPMSLLTMPLGLLRENYQHDDVAAEPSQGEPRERHLALAVGLVGMLAAVVIAFA